MICLCSNIGCSESKVIFKQRKNNNNKNKKAFTKSKRSHLLHFIQSQSKLSQNETNKRRRYKMHRSRADKGYPPWHKLAQNVFPPWKTNIDVTSLQSITRSLEKRFREVFGNARILIFYLSIKAWEEKYLPKSHLRCFFLVFGEGKATKENISIFWFIWPLRFHTLLVSVYLER